MFCRLIFASFHQGKEEKYIAFICIQAGQILSSNYLASTAMTVGKSVKQS
jgi:hypothetical protein